MSTKEIASRLRLKILVNRSAGRRGRDSLAGLTRQAAALGIEGAVVPIDPGGLEPRLRELAAQGGTVAVAGGDGTLRTAAQVLSGTASVLLPIPTGTLNHFARRLGIADARHAFECLEGGGVEQVPVGRVGDLVFLNTATFGFYADVVRRREALRRWIGKWPAAAIAGLRVMSHLPHIEVTLEIDGEPRHFHTALVWVGLGRGSFPRAHESAVRPGDGAAPVPELEVTVLRPVGPLQVLRLFFRLALKLHPPGRAMHHPALEALHARSVVLHARRAVGVTLDGEVMRLRPPIEVAVNGLALRVLCPPPEP